MTAVKAPDAFSNAILFYADEGTHKNNWAKAIYEGLQEQNFDEVPFRVPQLLEPSVLEEVGSRVGLPAEAVENFQYDLDGPVRTLKWLHDMVKWATPVQRLNLAVCLSATCRYQLAKRVLSEVPYRALYPDQRLAFHIAKFAIDNRLDNTAEHQKDFQILKEIIESGAVAPERILDVAAQAIVWSIKGPHIERSLFSWFVELGNKTAMSLSSSVISREQISLSSYYRAFAMVPAADGMVEETRLAMEEAERFADLAATNAGASSISLRDAKKTVLESKLKEMLYVVHDLERAREAGAALLALDENWSISHHEVAEVELAAGNIEGALRHYKRAFEVGLPRLAYSQYMIGACLEQLRASEEAISAYRKTLEIDTSNISAGIAGYNLSKELSLSERGYFEAYLGRWSQSGLLTEEMRGMLK